MVFIILHLLITVLSLWLLIKGSEWLLKGAVVLADHFKISKLAVASTLIAIGTGLPTIAVNLALISIGGSNIDAAVGNAIGTNYVNIGLALGIPAFLVTITAKYEVFEKEIPLFFAVTSLFTAFALDSKITRLEGVFLLVVYALILFIIYQYSIRDKVEPEFNDEVDVDTSTISKTETRGTPLRGAYLHILLGAIVLIGSSIVLANLTPILASDLNVSIYLIGLVVMGVGTSLPAIVTSIRSARRGYIDIVLGNVFGGSIANIALGLGLTAVIQTLPLSSEAVSDTYYFSIFTMIVLISILIEMKLLGNSKTLSKVSGFVMIVIYLVYLLSKVI